MSAAVERAEPNDDDEDGAGAVDAAPEWHGAWFGGGGDAARVWYAAATASHGAPLLDAATGRDDTGVLAWAATDVMGEALASPGGRRLVRGARVVELGAGCGLCGLLTAALGAAAVTLTDVNAAALRFAAMGAERAARESGGACDVSVAALDWLSFRGGAPASPRFAADVVIASDVVYPDSSTDALDGLCAAVAAVLRCGDRCGDRMSIARVAELGSPATGPLGVDLAAVADLARTRPIALVAFVDRDGFVSAKRLASHASRRGLLVRRVDASSFTNRRPKLDGALLWIDRAADATPQALYEAARAALPGIARAELLERLEAEPCTCSERGCGGDDGCSCARCRGLRAGCRWELEDQAFAFGGAVV